MTQALDIRHKELPSGWKWVKLGDVVETITNGCSVKQNWDAQGYLVSRIETISSGQIDLDRTAWVELEEAQAKKYALSDGDILFSHINSLERVGNCALYNRSSGNLIHGMNLLRIQMNHSHVNPGFLKSYLRSRTAKGFYLTHAGQAVNQASLNIANLKLLPIPLPPLEEQKRIAGILNKQMAAVEGAKKAAQERLEAAKALPGAYLREVFPSTGEELPQGWKWVKLGDVGGLGSGGTPSKANEKYWGHEYPFLTGADITSLYVSGEQARSFLSNEGLTSGKTSICKPNTVVVVTRTGVGRIGIASETLGVSQDISPFECSRFIQPEYICRYLLSISGVLQANTRGSTIRGITKEFLLSLPIPLPPLEEQKRIATELDDKISRAKLVGASIQQELDTIKALPAAQLRRAFSGGL